MPTLDEDSLQKVERLKYVLVCRATGRTASDTEYKELREHFQAIPDVFGKLPRFVRGFGNLDEFWEFIRPKLKTYAERRQYLQAEFEAVLTLLESRASAVAQRQEPPNTRPDAVSSDDSSGQPTLRQPSRKRGLSVFICHSSGDKAAVRALYRRLKLQGIQPWLDEEDLLPGQEWQQEISKAVRDSHIVLVCLSRSAIMKDGFVQREIGFALDRAQDKPEGAIYIVPLRLEECVVPSRLSRWHWVDLYKDDGFERLMRTLKNRANAIKRPAPKARAKPSKTTKPSTPGSVKRSPASRGGLSKLPKGRTNR